MTSYRGKHRKQSTTGRNVARLAVAGAVAAAPFVVTAGTASAATPNWDALAKCESGGNASINTGNGYSGLYQFKQSTWLAYGGGAYGQNAHQATAAQQTEIAQRLYNARGANQWPGCTKKTGWANGGGGGGSTKAKPVSKKQVTKKAAPVKKAATPAPAATAPVKIEKNGADYTVVAGDTLSKIAAANNVEGGWKALFERNKDVVKDANLIIVGQQLDLK
ncbi:transglycosylase family protein [Allokutzneria oryzae]|uniref:Transglycosylase family protein n=1 Tax=Allokutzneria oryzae TaxID=1378989 RepID=A0ABV6A6U2_9PSEU